MLKIRLRRVGKRHQPSYRVVVTEHTAPAQGSYLEMLGSYNPRAHQFTVKEDRVQHWLNNGAQPSERMAKLLTNAGVTHKLIVLPDYDRKPKRAPKKAQPEAKPVAEAKAPETATEQTAEVAAEQTTTETSAEAPAEAVAEENHEAATPEAAEPLETPSVEESASPEEGSTPPADAAPESE